MNRPKTHAPPILNDARVSHHRGEHLAAMRNHLGACRTYFHARVAGPESAAARREAQRIPGVFASLATTQMRFLAATRRDGSALGLVPRCSALQWAHHCRVLAPRTRPKSPPVACAKVSPTGSQEP